LGSTHRAFPKNDFDFGADAESWIKAVPRVSGTALREPKPKKQKGRASPTFHSRLCDQCQYIRGQSAKRYVSQHGASFLAVAHVFPFIIARLG
jgi:hypothetical protein